MDFASKSVYAEADKLKSAWMPQVQFSYQYLVTNDPLNAFGFKLQQSSIGAQDFNPELLNHPETQHHSNAQLKLQQNLFPAEHISMHKGMVTRGDAVKWQRQRAEEKLILDVKNAYSDLQYLYEALEVSRQAIKTFEENEKQVERFIQQGLAKKVDGMEIAIERNQVSIQMNTLQKSIENLSHYIGLLMGDSTLKFYKPAGSLQFDQSELQISAVTTRSDIKAMDAGLLALKHFKKANQAGRFPGLFVFGEYNLYDQDPFGFGENAYLAGIQLRWTLFDGSLRSNEIKRLKFETDKLKMEKELLLEQTNMEVNKINNERLLVIQNMENYRLDVKLSEEKRRIIKDRFDQGLEKPTDLHQAELQLTASKLKYIEGVRDYSKLKNLLEFLLTNTNHN
mgnify:CR=1 FL=1